MNERILIADDDLLLLEAIAAALAEPGRTIVTAHDSETLIEALASEPFDLVITDLDTPWMTSIDIDTPIIAITALEHPYLEARVAELAPHARVLHEPLTLPRLERAVQDALR